MLQMPNQQSIQSCEQVNCLSSIPLDKCCLVVQMPSIEEMKREVADITCKMQSVYIDSKMDDDAPKKLDDLDQASSAGDTNKITNDESNTSEASRFRKYTDNYYSNNQLEKLKSCTFGSTPNTNMTVDKDDDYLLPTSSVKTSSSTLPREEQVFEEFVINGKRYRQVYQRRVVLERRTTRDVFFLPANNPDSDVNPSGLRCFEYTSPEYGDDKPILVGASTTETLEKRLRPGLDLTVLHPSNGSTNDENGITPAVIMRTVPDLCRSPKTNSLDRADQNGVSTSPKPLNAIPTLSNSENHVQNSMESLVKKPILDNCIKQSDPSLNRSRSRRIMKNLSETIRRHIQCGLRRPKSHSKSENKASFQAYTENGSVEKTSTNGDVTNALKQSQCSNNGRQICDAGSREMFGYMYKFGVWDDHEPVLDPRLPRAIHSSKKTSLDLDGTVIPTPPEWHHAEVGLERSKSPNSPFVRGRTVACLQRFTQHSSASGKPLHRSTYVQQTRLVRQRNRDAPSKDLDKDQTQPTKTEDNDSDACRLSSQSNSGLTDSKNTISEPNNSSSTPNERESTWQLDTMEFAKCSNDRLQLLQSLCPSAAAAAILLGKRMPTPSSLGSDCESAFDKLNNMDDLGETSVLVTAKTWCPSTLLTKDPSAYLILNSHSETNSPTCSNISNGKVSPGSTGLPEMSIRGGTLDALLIQIVHILQMPSSEYPDCLLPDVLRVTYSTFTTPDKIIQRLIQYYIAHAPIEPGCQSSDWMDALTAVDYLITITQRLEPEQLSASLVLRLVRFARLLELDGQIAIVKPKSNDVPIENEQDIMKTVHKELADRLSSKLPVLSSTTRLRFYSSEYSGSSNGHGQNQVSDSDSQSQSTTFTDIVSNDTTMKQENSTDIPCSVQFHLNGEEMEPALQRIQQFLQSHPLSIAEELTRLEEEQFKQINFQELLNIQQLERGEAKSLGVCVEHFNKLTKWARSLLFVLSPKLAEYAETLIKSTPDKAIKRQTGNVTLSPIHVKLPKRSSSHSRNYSENTNRGATDNLEQPSNGTVRSKHSEGERSVVRQKSCYIRFPVVGLTNKSLPIREVASLNSMFAHMCEILKHLNQLNNFSSFLALLLAIQEVPDCILSKKSKSQLAAFSAYMKPPNFAEYRRDLEAAELPCLPYLGLIFQQLIHLHAGNPIFLPDMVENSPKHDITMGSGGSALVGAMSSVTHQEKLINVWRCWKHYLILGYFIKREEGSPKSRHNIPLNEKINQILNNFNDCYPENVLDFAKDQLVSRMKTKRTFRP